MSTWLSPDMTTLHDVVSASGDQLLLCSPYVSTPALSVVANALPKRVKAVEVWTKLDVRDWLTGASDPEGLLGFIGQVEGSARPVTVRRADHLHAKLIVSDGAKAMAGSANLTTGGFARNIELARVVTGREVEQLRDWVSSVRPRLHPVSTQELARFVSDCAAKETTKEALLDLIRQEIPPYRFGADPLMPYQDFKSFLQSHDSDLARDLLGIANNDDGNNNTGKVKQAFFGVQRFLREYPNHFDAVASLPLEWFDVATSELARDWQHFLRDFSGETNDAYGYSIPTLMGYLPEAYGGTLRGGGGGLNQFKRVWPLAARAIRAFES